MIPKKIHYVWLGDTEIPDSLKECMDSWRRLMPDYEIIRWDENKIKDLDNTFINEALKMRKWAFASDVIRLYALFHEGGIYLDTDVMVFKPFNDLLNLPAFIGAENVLHIQHMRTTRCLTSYCMGTEAGNPFFKKAIDYYSDRHFIRTAIEELPDDLRYETTVNSYILMEIARTFGYNPYPKASLPQTLSNGMKIFPFQWFNPIIPDSNSYIEHRAEGSWRKDYNSGHPRNFFKRIKRRTGINLRSFIHKLGYAMVKLQ